MTRPIPQYAIDFLKKAEACKLTAYRDSANIWTVGYGHTAPTVVGGLTINQLAADTYLHDDLEHAAGRLSGAVKADVIEDLTDHQYAALLSFVFNLGCQPSWGIWKRLNARQFDQVPGEMMRFVNAGGKKLQGLVNRRAAEVVLWSTAEPGSAPDEPASSVTRAMPTPPTPTDPTPAGKSATIIGGALAVAGTVPTAAKTIIDTVSPYQEYAPLVGKLIAVAGVAGAVAAIVVLVLTWLRKHREQHS